MIQDLLALEKLTW